MVTVNRIVRTLKEDTIAPVMSDTDLWKMTRLVRVGVKEPFDCESEKNNGYR